MDDFLLSLNEIDEAVDNFGGAAKKILKAFIVAAQVLEDISKDADGPEDCARAKKAIADIKKLMGEG